MKTDIPQPDGLDEGEADGDATLYRSRHSCNYFVISPPPSSDFGIVIYYDGAPRYQNANENRIVSTNTNREHHVHHSSPTRLEVQGCKHFENVLTNAYKPHAEYLREKC